MSVQISYKKQFIFSILFLIVILSALEISSRTYEFFNPLCDFIHSETQQNISKNSLRQLCFDHSVIKWNESPYRNLIENQHTQSVNINSLGFRGDEINLKDDDYLIFLVGGSTIYGSGVTDQQTIPYYLGKELQRNDFSAVVVNSGVPGIHSFTEIKLIENKIINLKPDMVIIYDGYNDLVKPHDQFYLTGENDFSSNVIRFFAKNEFWRTGAVVITNYFLFTNPEQIETSTINVSETNKKVDYWSKNINKLCENSKDQFETIIILQPFLGTGDKELTNNERQIYDKNNHVLLVSEYEKYRQNLSLMNHCSKVMDFSNVFDNLSVPTYMDFVHISSEGNKLIAKKIANEISPFIRN